MRIAILSLDKGGGTAHCAYDLAKVMADKVQITCYLAAQNELLSDFEALPCRVRTFPMKRGPGSLLKSMLVGRESSGIAQAIESDAPDMILDAGSGVWSGLVLKTLRGRIPIAQIVHDVFPHPDLRSRIDSLPARFYGSPADILIALSDFSYRQLAVKYPRQEHIHSRLGIILPPGEINLQSVANRRHKQLFFGRIHPYKGVDILVHAFAIAKQLDPAIELTIVGRGPVGTRLLQRIAELGIGLDNRYISDDEIRQVVSSHGVMVLPYTSATQSAVAALALANGMPCIATSVGALPEQVIDGSNGFIVPPGDPEALARAMVTISGEAATAHRMAGESLRIGRELYSWNVIGQALLDDLIRFLAVRKAASSAGH